MKIQPISFEKKYRKPRTSQKATQGVQTQALKQQINPQEAKAELIKQAEFAQKEAQKIKQSANSAKIRGFEVLDNAKKNKEYANALYEAIKAENISDKDFAALQFEGITYKVHIAQGKCRATGQSRGFFGKKDIFEFDIKRNEPVSILKGYEKDKNSDIYTSCEEYYFPTSSAYKVFFNTTTDKTRKNSKEGFVFYDGELKGYNTNAKMFLNDFEYGEFEKSYSFDLFNTLSCCNVGLNCVKNSFEIKQAYHFSGGKFKSYIKDCEARLKGRNSVCNNGVMIEYRGDKPDVGYINYHVTNEMPSIDFKYEFQPQSSFGDYC